MPLFGSITGSKSGSESEYKRNVDFWTPKQKKTAGMVYADVLKPGFSDYEQQFSGKPTDIESTALSRLQTYGAGSPAYMDQAGAALSRALTGEGYKDIVDPAAAENLYSSIEERTLEDILPKAVKSAATQANVGGMLRSGTGQQLVTDEIGRIVNALSEQLAALRYSDEQQRRDIAREREGRQLSAIPQTGTLQATELARILPGLQYGGLERDIAGTRYQNPLTQLALQYLGLRGQQDITGSSSASGWNLGGKAGVELP